MVAMRRLGGYQRYLALKALGRLSHLPGRKWLKALRSLLPYRSAERSKLRYFRELSASPIAARESSTVPSFSG